MEYLYIPIGTYETKHRFQLKNNYASETLTGLFFETRKMMKFNHCYTALNMCSITTDA